MRGLARPGARLCPFLERYYVVAALPLGAGEVKDVENLKNNGP